MHCQLPYFKMNLKLKTNCDIENLKVNANICMIVFSLVCHCNGMGSNRVLCDHSGSCSCKDGYHGRKCNVCKRGYYTPIKGLCVSKYWS